MVRYYLIISAFLVLLIGGRFFFCSSQDLKPADLFHKSHSDIVKGDKVSVAVSGGELREKPSLCSNLLCKLSPGTELSARDIDKYGWVYVSSDNGYEGWIHMKFLAQSPGEIEEKSLHSTQYRGDLDVHIKRTLASRGSSVAAGVVQTAYKCLGIPYVWGGSTPSGFDCSGFVQWVYAQNGVNITRTADTQYAEGRPVEKLAPGDLVFFTTYAPGASHVGIYLANSLFIHASSAGQVKISSLEDSFYKAVFLGGRRYFN